MPIYPRQTKRSGLVYDVVVYGGPKPIWRRGKKKLGPINERDTAMWEEARLKNELRLGRPVPSEKLSLSDYLEKTFLPSKQRGNPGTYRLYVTAFDRLKQQPARGSLLKTPLAKVTAKQIFDWRMELEADGLSPNTVRNYMSKLAVALEMAKKLGMVSDNHARAVKMPSPRKRVPWILTVPEVNELLEMAARTQYGPLIALAVYTAKRWSELTKLTWRDVDFERRHFFVRTAKGRASETGVPLSAPAILELQLQKMRVKALKEKAGDFWQENDLVFCGKRGLTVVEQTFGYTWTRMVEPRWPGLHFHDLRHVSITLMAWAGVHPRAAQDMAGQETGEMTMQVYTHITAENRRAAADAIAGLLKGHS